MSHVLAGAAELLEKTEVILTELQFNPINDNGWAKRLRIDDVLFVRRDSPLLADRAWDRSRA
jgi:hypothetical protein